MEQNLKVVNTGSANLGKDPVCEMMVDKASAKHTAHHSGVTYYFCCTSCANKFKANPEKYLQQNRASKSSGPVLLGSSAAEPMQTTKATARATSDALLDSAY